MMNSIPLSQGALVVTSISAPNPVLKALAGGCLEWGMPFFLPGDSKSPEGFSLDGCLYSSLSAQRRLPFRYAALCPERSYTRKNIGYLQAMAGGARFIVETDDDNFPRGEFWEPRQPEQEVEGVNGLGWRNVYHCFADSFIYPRGFPVDQARLPEAQPERSGSAKVRPCFIQQGLADENPDVDAIYRMLFPLPFNFRQAAAVCLQKDQWCPFNSQNTTTFRDAFALLYLPAHCSFRMTDIWRSFVAQRILWTWGAGVSFHSATVYQERNEHDLTRDFEDEIPGYRHNAAMARALEALPLRPGREATADNLRACYEAMIEAGWVGADERALLEAWLADVQDCAAGPNE